MGPKFSLTVEYNSLVKLGKINFDPLQTSQMELSYIKDVNGFDVKVGSNYSMASQIPDYGANIEVSSKF